ncbi:hypothetical protein GCM10023196_035500 [Actinoallomurus vinaceus]|uniref:Tape measure protein n=1 Tax=Actinoallomurus vinaceus TaxID=1080074 RepID=A0ABP8U8U6_9ACTN
MATIKNLLIRIGVEEDTSRGIRKVTGELEKTSKEADKADKSSNRLSGTLSKLGKISGSGLAKLGSAAITAGKGIAVLAAAAGGLNTVVQAATALAPLAGLYLLIPGAALGAAAALGTLKLAISGVSEGFKAALGNDPKKYAEALKTLPPAARSVATELHKLAPELKSIQATAAQNLFAPLHGQLTAVAKVLVGPVKQGVADVGLQFGLVARQAALFLRQTATAAVLRQTFSTVAGSIHQLIPALQPVLIGFRNLASVGLQFLPQIAGSVSVIAQRFGLWLQRAVATGRATAWIQNALATLKQIGGVLSNVGGILKSVFSAASAGGSQFLGILGAALAQLNAFLKTAQGQAALTSIFQTLGAIGTTLGPVIGALVTQVGTLARPLGQLAQLVGPILLTAINALGPALALIAPGLQALFGGLSQAVTAIAASGALPALGQAIAQIGIAAAPLLPVVGQLAALLAKNLAASVTTLLAVLGPVISALAQSLAPILPQIAAAFSQLAVAMAPIATQFGQQLGQALVKILPPLLQIVPQLLQGLVPALVDLLTALQPLMPQLIQLGVVLAQNLAQSLPLLLPSLIHFVELLVDLVAMAVPVVGWILRISTALAGDLGTGLTTALKLVAAMVDGVIRLFRDLFDILLGHSIIPDIVRGTISWFAQLPGRVAGIFYSMAAGAISQAAGLLRYVSGIPGAIARTFAGAGSWLYNAGRAIMIGLWDGVASLWNWLVARFRDLTNLIPRIKGPPEKDRRLLTPAGVAIMQGLGEGIASQIPALRSTLGRVTNAIALPGAGVQAAPAAAGAAAGAPRGVTAAAGGGGGTVVLEVRSGGSKVDDLLVELLRKAVRVHGGGNVQLALGDS